MFEHIMVAFDNSNQAQKALDKAFQIAEFHHSFVELISVVLIPDYAATIDEVEEMIGDGKRFYQAIHERYAAEAKARDIKFASKVLQGHIGESIVNYANDNALDLIVMGSYGRSAISRLLMGSVSNYVVRHARCPVMVVKE
ncbi:universal stress protein [Pelotomaculum propionicicum]|uniref:Universal stress protein n=1 Tax=Pelotomaculum propionicicum TaxID=258475 RepID=A0A4Y7RM66_9FIRM|nr:universal stress protein [Pelotomaculum propionicicum]NLI12259.1 universal stress protein [Peptococcaceae bacterium]TEB09963.1 TRAP-T-associated universal stress protein TeaD [Pelotomaculum propionicicum]